MSVGPSSLVDGASSVDPLGPKQGFAGGVRNTVAMHSSYAVSPSTHVFLEGSLILEGVRLADDVGGAPVVVNLGLQHAF